MLNYECNNVLVTVVVVTYNSSKYVLETLESIKHQTYSHVELIITDDHSTDDTVDLCATWLAHYGRCFVKTKLVTSEVNTGISPNCNRGLNNATGSWVKFLAGDDMLVPTALSDYMRYIEAHPDCHVLSGRIYDLKDGIITVRESKHPVFSKQGRQQYICLLKNAGIPAQSLIFCKSVLESIHGFDERYPFCEDGVLYVKLAERGVCFRFIDEFVAIYRSHECNISSRSVSWFNLRFYFSYEQIVLREIIPRQYAEGLYISLFSFINKIIVDRAIIVLGNRNNRISTLISRFYIAGLMSSVKRYLKNRRHA